MKTIKYTHPALNNEDTDEPQYYSVQAKRIICFSCNGYGTHTRRDLDDSAMVDSMQEDGDYDGLKAYYDGAYDEVCDICNGSKVIDIIDWEYFGRKYPTEYKKISDYVTQASKDRHYEAMERRATGC